MEKPTDGKNFGYPAFWMVAELVEVKDSWMPTEGTQGQNRKSRLTWNMAETVFCPRAQLASDPCMLRPEITLCLIPEENIHSPLEWEWATVATDCGTW